MGAALTCTLKLHSTPFSNIKCSTEGCVQLVLNKLVAATPLLEMGNKKIRSFLALEF